MNICVIGGGNMGLTYAKSIYDNFENTTISVVDKDPQKLEELKATTPFLIFDDAKNCVADAQIVLMAVKPQISGLVFNEIQDLITDQVIVSIMAGVTIHTLQNGLNTPKIVRAMPNLPSQVGHGVTGYIASAEVNEKEQELVQQILSSTGKAIALENETAIDAITALSGSGPAYVFYFMNAMIEKAQSFGFSPEDAKNIVLHTFSGTTDLFESSPLSAETWIDRVTSKGGTTHAALTSFKSNEIAQNIEKGVQAAFDRAQELGKA